jgi:pyruvate/2-oxoglutarate dehydrogenase complex dihydrolipoamide dehydrogenase (E3) component
MKASKILLNTRIERVSGKSGHSVSVAVEQGGSEKVLQGSHLLVAAGRTPNAEGLGLDLAGRSTASEVLKALGGRSDQVMTLLPNARANRQ